MRVERSKLTLNGFECRILIFGVKIAKSLANHETQFDFIMQTDTLGTEDGALAGEEDGGRGLQEEEGLLGGRAVQLCDVFAIVPH